MRIKALPVESFKEAPPGAFQILNYEDVAGIKFVCPCGCNRMGYLPIDTQSGSPRWDWNGDRENPSLHPSVLWTDKHWHGFLKEGFWEDC